MKVWSTDLFLKCGFWIGGMFNYPHYNELRQIANIAEALGGRRHAQGFCDIGEFMADNNLRTAVFGEFSVGKSTLINALLGCNALPAKAMPTTGHATRIRFGLSEGVNVTLTDGRRESCKLEQVNSFVTLNMQSRAREDIESIEIVINTPFLRDGLTVIDTPGINDADAQTLRAERADMSCDFVLLVLRAEQMLGSDIRQRAAIWMAQELGKPVVPILNCLNLVEAKDQDELRRLLGAWANSSLTPFLGKPFFEVNAIGALRYVLKIDGAQRPTDDFFALKTAIEGLRGSSRQEIQKSSRTNQLRAVLCSAIEWNNRELGQLKDAADLLQDTRKRHTRNLRRSIEGLRARINSEKMLVRSLFNKKLDRGWERLARRLASKGKDELDQKASQWFDRYLEEAVRKAETQANERLIRLAAELEVPPPELLTISQFIAMNQRAEVQFIIPDNSSAKNAGAWGGAVAGAAIGSVIPIVGTFFGALVGYVAGASIADKAIQQEPDYIAAHTNASRTDWANVAPDIELAAIEQFNARLKGLIDCLEKQVADLERTPIARTELPMRLNIQRLMAQALEHVGNPQARKGTTELSARSKWPI